MREVWQTLTDKMGISSVISFSGWLSQSACAARLQCSDILVLPSLFECGRAVVLEAMAMGLPVIATEWGESADYLDESCGVLVKPASRKALVDGFAGAMVKSAESSELRARLGDAGYKRARAHFDWERKIDQILKFHTLATQTRTQLNQASEASRLS
jgi:glycosyltransferase involved in cell wall biosynthesis